MQKNIINRIFPIIAKINENIKIIIFIIYMIIRNICENIYIINFLNINQTFNQDSLK